MTVERPARIAVVGSGWRAEHFFRIFTALPEQFELVGVAVRREAEATRLAAQGIETVTELARLVDLEPDFVVVATPAEANADVATELAGLGLAMPLDWQ